MKLSELLSFDVVDADGRRVGAVRSVRLVQDGPVLGGAQAAMRVDAVIAGGGTVGMRLGYVRGGVRGPLLLRSIFGRSERRSQTFLMADLEWDTDAKLLRARQPSP
jgi:hypothetical protein